MSAPWMRYRSFTQVVPWGATYKSPEPIYSPERRRQDFHQAPAKLPGCENDFVQTIKENSSHNANHLFNNLSRLKLGYLILTSINFASVFSLVFTSVLIRYIKHWDKVWANFQTPCSLSKIVCKMPLKKLLPACMRLQHLCKLHWVWSVTVMWL